MREIFRWSRGVILKRRLPTEFAKALEHLGDFGNYFFSSFRAAVFKLRLSKDFNILAFNFLRFSGSCCSIPHVQSASKQSASSFNVSLSTPKSSPNAIKIKCGLSILKDMSFGSSFLNFHFS